MFTKIKTNKNIAQSLRYHELKLDQKQAQCIVAENFLSDLDELTRKDKLRQLQRLTTMNERAQLNTIHISINFHSSETISSEKMAQIAREYMAEIGLSDQPYLVYRHNDAHHPHCHVLCPKFYEDGKRIELNNVIRKESLKISRELEIRHNLVSLQKQSLRLRQENDSTVQKIEEAVQRIIPIYKYTNLEELNALLGTHHVEAYRGNEESRLYQRRGLIYRVIDENGRRITAPIKASALDGQPTLKHLEDRFEDNLVQREEHRERMTLAIDWTLYKNSLSYGEFKEALRKENIRVIDKRDDSGQVQKIWYVDLLNKAVWDAESLGQTYGVKETLRRCITEEEYRLRQENEHSLTYRLRHKHF